MQVRLYDCRKTGRLPLLYTVLKFSGAHRSLPPFPGTANPCYSACGGTNPVKIAWLVPPQDVQRRFLAPRFGKRHKPVKCCLTHAEKRITPPHNTPTRGIHEPGVRTLSQNAMKHGPNRMETCPKYVTTMPGQEQKTSSKPAQV